MFAKCARINVIWRQKLSLQVTPLEEFSPKIFPTCPIVFPSRQSHVVGVLLKVCPVPLLLVLGDATRPLLPQWNHWKLCTITCPIMFVQSFWRAVVVVHSRGWKRSRGEREFTEIGASKHTPAPSSSQGSLDARITISGELLSVSIIFTPGLEPGDVNFPDYPRRKILGGPGMLSRVSDGAGVGGDYLYLIRTIFAGGCSSCGGGLREYGGPKRRCWSNPQQVG